MAATDTMRLFAKPSESKLVAVPTSNSCAQTSPQSSAPVASVTLPEPVPDRLIERVAVSVSRTEISNGTTPERALGPDHPHTLTYRNNLARAYLATGQTTDVDGLDSLSPEIRQLWGPLLAAAVATATGRADQHTTWALDTRLDHLATYPGWATLTVVVRRIITGERNPELLAGLDTIDTTITTALLKRLDDTGRGAKRWWRRRR